MYIYDIYVTFILLCEGEETQPHCVSLFGLEVKVLFIYFNIEIIHCNLIYESGFTISLLLWILFLIYLKIILWWFTVRKMSLQDFICFFPTNFIGSSLELC